MSISVSLLELCPSSKASASTLSDLGGARFGFRAAEVLDDAEAGDCELDGPALDGLEFCGLEFCAKTPKQNPSNETGRKLRINLFYRSPRVARNACRHLRAVSNSENRLPSCSMR